MRAQVLVSVTVGLHLLATAAGCDEESVATDQVKVTDEEIDEGVLDTATAGAGAMGLVCREVEGSAYDVSILLSAGAGAVESSMIAGVRLAGSIRIGDAESGCEQTARGSLTLAKGPEAAFAAVRGARTSATACTSWSQVKLRGQDNAQSLAGAVEAACSDAFAVYEGGAQSRVVTCDDLPLVIDIAGTQVALSCDLKLGAIAVTTP